MSVKTGKTGSIYAVNDITPFTTEATTEAGATKIYQIDSATKRMWDINATVTISAGDLDTSYCDGGINYFEGKVKLLTTGEVALTVSGSSLTIKKTAAVFGWGLDMTNDVGEKTEIGDTWKTNMSLGKSASVSISRYRTDTDFDSPDYGYQECGLSDKALTTATGLTNTTQYYFKANVDGAGVVEEDFTTATDTTYSAVITLMNATLAAGGTFELVNGDLRCRSDSNGTSSSIALSAGTTGADAFATLTDFSAFNTAVAGSNNVKYFLLKLMEDDTEGYWCNASKTSISLTKSLGAIDQESLSFNINSNVIRI